MKKSLLTHLSTPRVLEYATDIFMTQEMFNKSVLKEAYTLEYEQDQLMTKHMPF